jgi:hypothetical protein
MNLLSDAQTNTLIYLYQTYGLAKTFIPSEAYPDHDDLSLANRRNCNALAEMNLLLCDRLSPELRYQLDHIVKDNHHYRYRVSPAVKVLLTYICPNCGSKAIRYETCQACHWCPFCRCQPCACIDDDD